MSEVEVSTPRSIHVSAGALRLVLFGMPHAGKSSLLGALLQAAQTQEHALHGKLTDLSQGLVELQRRLYEDQPHITPEEIVSYPVLFEPFAGKSPNQTKDPLEVELIDCSGLVANELLSRQRSLDAESSNSEQTLALSVLQADALLLVVDASTTPSQLDADFTQFARFLGLLERKRGKRKDVGGIPVFLVLTKCDLLAKPGDSAGAWMEQIEERKRQVAQRFNEFLAQTRDREGPRFGSVHLQLWATAVKRPALAPAPEKPREPYGVAELFRQGLASARSYRQAQRRAGRRLLGTVAGMFGILLLLLAAGALLFFLWEKPGPLEARVARYRSRVVALSPAAAHRTARADIDELIGFTRDPGFSRLPEGTQEYVQERLRELEAYETFGSRLGQITDPADATSMAQLDQMETNLKRLTMPEEYRAEWSQTDLGRRYADWLEDAAALRTAVLKVEGWYQKLVQDGQQVLDNINGPNLPARAKKVLQEAQSPPFPDNDPERLLAGSRRVSYAHVFSFASVREARRAWEEIKKKLEPYAKFEP